MSRKPRRLFLCWELKELPADRFRDLGIPFDGERITCGGQPTTDCDSVVRLSQTVGFSRSQPLTGSALLCGPSAFGHFFGRVYTKGERGTKSPLLWPRACDRRPQPDR